MRQYAAYRRRRANVCVEQSEQRSPSSDLSRRGLALIKFRRCAAFIDFHVETYDNESGAADIIRWVSMLAPERLKTIERASLDLDLDLSFPLIVVVY